MRQFNECLMDVNICECVCVCVAYNAHVWIRRRTELIYFVKWNWLIGKSWHNAHTHANTQRGGGKCACTPSETINIPRLNFNVRGLTAAGIVSGDGGGGSSQDIPPRWTDTVAHSVEIDAGYSAVGLYNWIGTHTDYQLDVLDVVRVSMRNRQPNRKHQL